MAFTATLVLQTIRAIEARGTLEMSHLVRQYISGVFVYAIGAGLAEDDPAHAIRSTLKPAIKGRRPAALKVADPGDFGPEGSRILFAPAFPRS